MAGLPAMRAETLAPRSDCVVRSIALTCMQAYSQDCNPHPEPLQDAVGVILLSGDHPPPALVVDSFDGHAKNKADFAMFAFLGA